MNGLGFIATLHATTLDDSGPQPILRLKPVKKPTRRPSTGSTFDRARHLVSRSKGLFSASSSTLIAAGRTSVSSTSFRSVSSKSSASSPSSSRLPSEDRRRERSPLPSPLSSVSFADAHTPVVVRIEAAPRFEEEWFAQFVDKEYTFAQGLAAMSEDEDDFEWEACASDVEPSRPSSTFERDLDFFDEERGSCKSSVLDLACSIDAEVDRFWSTHYQKLHKKAAPRQVSLAQTRHHKARPLSTTT
ncbi:uncharacterized protein SRS1_12345 [Sporisorium reilianum f. sp. reilianum]|uniref:Uncharacterized protein n=1 Tax=Sporisorium reilianum f. sp. reilianum TaxID=72559 RepID=A0A2N8UA09_9BASI|nr:uncharacterized protein SRS1_12345 [Sporisorium reilianum f. sp. reilianum]